MNDFLVIPIAVATVVMLIGAYVWKRRSQRSLQIAGGAAVEVTEPRHRSISLEEERRSARELLNHLKQQAMEEATKPDALVLLLSAYPRTVGDLYEYLRFSWKHATNLRLWLEKTTDVDGVSVAEHLRQGHPELAKAIIDKALSENSEPKKAVRFDQV